MTALFEGRVQGVGFRFTTLHLAAGLDIRGFVRNEEDGSVTVVAEGQEDQLLALVHRVKMSNLGRYIVNAAICWSMPTGEFRDFSIQTDGW